MSRPQLPVPNAPGGEAGIIIKVFLVNGESRSLRIYQWYTVTDILQDILPRLHVNMDVALDLFGIQFRNSQSKEFYWLQPNYPVLQLVHEYSAETSVADWQFLLLVRILPKTPQHISEVDSISFQYFYDQVLNRYLADDSIMVDNDAAVKLGCLELRRFFKDMSHAAIKKKENFTMLEKEIGLEKFFKKSLLETVRKKQLRTLVLNAFKEYEYVSTDICMFKFFNLLSKYHRIDEDMFSSCAVGNSQSLPLNCEIFVGPNCNIEYKVEGKERRFLAAFSDIQGISYETELISRGKIILELRNNPTVVIRTAVLVTAIDMSSLIDSYCIVFTEHPHSRLTGIKRFSTSQMSEGLYNTIDELRLQHPGLPGRGSGGPLPYSTFRSSMTSGSSEFSNPHELSELEQYEVVAMREYRTIPPQDLMLGEKIGEGQFGDVHNGFLYPKTVDEIDVAIKTCKPDASNEDRVKFLEEASVMCKFKHPNIIKLYGVVSHMDLAYIVMELAPHGQLRRYLLLEGTRITRMMLLSYIAQLASAMVHLEDMNYVHRDIAARNVLVCDPQTVKLADFGLSRGLEDGDYYVASRGKLPIKWMAPESINFRRFTGLSDVWMFGVCCWEILMRGVKPFVGIKNDEVISKIESGERLALPMECPAPLYSLMNMCWKYDPLERPRFLDIEARIQEIIGEMMDVEQRPHSSRQRYSTGIIQRDPNAPAKPVRHGAPTPPMVARVPSNNSAGPERGGPRVNEVQQQPLPHHMDNGGQDLPPRPPRAMERFRDLSTSPPSTGGGDVGGSSPTPPVRKLPGEPHHHQHPSQSSSSGREGGGGRQPNDSLPPPPPPNITPYSVTTITPAEDRHTHQTRSESPMAGRHRGVGADSPLGGYHTNSHIPPPAILTHNQRTDPEIYYSAPPEVMEKNEKKQQRVLTEDGVFVSRDVRSPHGGVEIGDPRGELRVQGVRPKLGEDRPISHASTEGSSEMNSPSPRFDDRSPPNPYSSSQPEEEREEGRFTVPDEDEILKLTTNVVKTVKELSNKVHKSKPADYVDLVKGIGLALRDLLSKTDESLTDLPQDTHTEINMAQKVLSSDMNHLVLSMKDAQAHYDKFLEQEYQKKMLKAAHVVAVNSKLLLDAVNSAKHKARLMR